MSEQLSNNQNNTDNTAPTGWENMANYALEETQAPVQEAPDTAASVQERAELVKRIKWLEQLRRQNPEIAAEMRQKARDALLEIVNESVPEYSDKFVADDRDGDGVKDGVEQENIAESKQFYEDTDEDKLRMLEFENMSNSELIGLFTNIMGDDEPTVSEYDTEPPMLTDVPRWLDSWEEKKKTF